MRAISLFSGAGGFELGFERAGIETVLQAENDPVCLSVLERHWPDVERVRDVRAISCDGKPAGGGAVAGVHARSELGRGQGGSGLSGSIDLVYGGFPCQDVSVAGNRAGLSGERSGLWHEFHRVLRELRPRWTVIENVPGLLSSGPTPGADFGVVLRGLVDLGYGVAWRVLDARWFGVPQRRRRVFIVGCSGDAARAAQVLAVCESCGGHPQAGSEAGERVAASLTSGAHGAGVNLPGRHHEDDVNPVLDVQNCLARVDEVGTLDASSRDKLGSDWLVADPISAHKGKTYTHEGTNNFRLHNVVNGVRRLTPLECERLMGWPDSWTKYAADGKEIPDSHRYRLCGNGVVSTVAEYIGHRLVAADAW